MGMVFAHARCPGSFWEVGQISVHQCQQLSLLCGGHGPRTKPFFRDDAVVLKGASECQFIAKCHPSRRHGRIAFLGVQLGLLLQIHRQRLHQFQSATFFWLEYSNPCKRSDIDRVRFRAHEHGGQDHLAADKPAVQAQVMPIKIPAPGFRGRWRAKQIEVVAVFVHDLGGLHEFTQKMIDFHELPRALKSLRTEAGAQDRHDVVSGLRLHFIKPQAKAHHVDLRIHPSAPLSCVMGMLDDLGLFWGQTLEQMFNCLHTGLHRRLFVLQREQSRHAFTLGGNAFEFSVLVKLAPAVKQLVGNGVIQNSVSV